MQIGSDYSGSMLNSLERLLRPRADQFKSANSTDPMTVNVNSEASKVAIVGSIQNPGTEVSTDPKEQETAAQTVPSEQTIQNNQYKKSWRRLLRLQS